MKSGTWVAWSVVFVIGCGGGARGYKISETKDKEGKEISLGVTLTPTGQYDGLGAVGIAMVGAGCSVVKAREPAGTGIFDSSEGLCGSIAMTFSQQKGNRILLVSCPIAVGSDACKGQLNKILDAARDARYIQ